MGTYVRGPLEARFWAKVQKTETCWLWIGALCSGGYGCIGVKRPDGSFSIKEAHRVSWELNVGPIPPSLYVLHDCEHLHANAKGSRRCVNPAHLWLGTHQENAIDMTRKGRRHVVDQWGEKNGSAKLSDACVRKIRVLYKVNNVSQSALAKRFGVRQSTISKIVNNKRWPKKEEKEA